VPNISEQEIVDGFKYLEKVGALERAPDGKLNFDSVKVWRTDVYDNDGFSVYTKGAEATAYLMQTPKVYRPSVYSSMALAMDEKNLLEAEKVMIETHHKLCKISNDSKDPTALMYIGNYLLTVLRL
jgi:hypothetical protein